MKHKKIPCEFVRHLIYLYNVDLHPLFGDGASSTPHNGALPHVTFKTTNGVTLDKD
jgi:hypothetical protein